MDRTPYGWRRKFEDQIPLPKGKPLVTLRDAALYITKQNTMPGMAATMQALLLVAERGGPRMLARIGVTRALHRTSNGSSTPTAKTLIGGRGLALDR